MPDQSIASILLIGSFAVFIVIRMPICFGLAVSTGITMFYLNIPIMTLVQQMSKSICNFSLMAIPLFIVAGEIMGVGGISDRLLLFSQVLVGRFRGGLSYVTVLASMFFGGISGSAVADVSSLGSIVIPLMEKAGYEKPFAVGLTVTAGCQGVLVPPSHNMIIYSVAAGGVSIGALFAAGIIPGIICGAGLIVVAIYFSITKHYPKGEPASFKQVLVATKDAILALMTAVIIFVGIVSGMFTATESGAVACIYAFIISAFIYKELTVEKMQKALMNSVKTLSLVFGLIATAGSFGWVMSYLRIPTTLTHTLLSFSDNTVVILLIINVMLLLLGCFMDMAPLILICTPILLPVVTALGMSPIQFGVLLMFNLGIGLCTPPVGSALFVGCGIGKISMEKAAKAMLPMFASMVIGLLLVTYVPAFSMWLPNLLGYK